MLSLIVLARFIVGLNQELVLDDCAFLATDEILGVISIFFIVLGFLWGDFFAYVELLIVG